MLGNVFMATVLLIIAVLTGWGIPLAVRSQRPYGLVGDIVASVLCLVVAGLVEWVFVLPALGITGWLAMAIAIGDPWGFALLVLWLMRRFGS